MKIGKTIQIAVKGPPFDSFNFLTERDALRKTI